MVNENGSPETPTPDKKGRKEYTIDMRQCVGDYANEIIGLRATYLVLGITKINEIMKNHKIVSFSEYLSKKKVEKKDIYDKLTEEDYKQTRMQTKIKELEKLAVKLNAEGATISKEDFEVLINRVSEIIH